MGQVARKVSDRSPGPRRDCVAGVARGRDRRQWGVITGELDDDSLSYDGAANDPTRASWPALAEVILSGDVPHADVEVVGS
jgi:hypothetical protein